MYSPMKSFSSFALGLGVVSSTAFIASGSLSPISHGEETRSLVSRQAPGVVATSDFLRRDNHACRLLDFQAWGVRTDFLYSGCCWRLGIYRWRRVLIYERWDNNLSILYALIARSSDAESSSDHLG